MGGNVTLIDNSLKGTTSNTATLSNDITNVMYYFNIASGITMSGIILPQLELGSTATAFAPYSNECPILGWSAVDVTKNGIQQWDEEWEVGTIQNSNGQNASDQTRIRSKNYIPVTPSTTYYMVCSVHDGRGLFYDANKNYLGNNSSMFVLGTFTTPSNCYYIRFSPVSSYGTTYNNDISINYPSTDTSYHACNGNTYSLTFTDGTNPLTVYGGYVDLISGVLTVTHQIVDLGDATWSYNDLTNVFDTSKIASSVVKPTSSTEVIDLQCSILAKNSSSGITDNPSVDGIAINTLGYIIARYSGMPTSSPDFKTAVTGQKLKFPLATPLTYQLSKQQIRSLVGENNIFASTGDVSVEYRRDPSLIINEILSRLNNV